MTARIIDGKRIAADIRAEIARDVATLVAAGKPRPGLAVVLVGDDPASSTYVRSKCKACEEAGFHSVRIDYPTTVTQSELLSRIAELNADPAIHGILVQLPLPLHMRVESIVNAIVPAKDVDGFHPLNAGLLALGHPAFVPCTPLGVVELLIREKIPTAGAHAVVLGRSNIVGRPMASLLLRKGDGGDATVTVCHSATKDLAGVVKSADILVAAIGRPEFVPGSWIKPGATVIDVGINRIDDPDAPKGSRLVGDVKYVEVAEVAGAVTPVPGGVGPMTIAMLLRNTMEAARRA